MTGKYNKKQLREMAVSLVKHKDDGDPRYNLFLTMCSTRCNVSIGYVEDRIKEYSEYD